MQEEKSYAYTIILGACMLLCLLMIAKMLLGQPESGVSPEVQNPTAPEQEEITMQLNENDLCGLIEQTLPMPVQEITAKIGADQTVSVVVLVSKQELQQSGLVPGGLRTMLLFLPDACRLYGAWQADTVDGKISLQCTRAEIADTVIPSDIASALTEQVASAINAYLSAQGIAPEQIQWTDGALVLGA